MTQPVGPADIPDFSSAVERYHKLYAQGPGVDPSSGSVVSRNVNRAAVALTHELREHQRQIHEALFDMIVATAAELTLVRSELRSALDEAAQAGELAAEARNEARLAIEANRSVADTATAFHRRTEDLESRVEVATSLNDDLSRSLEELSAELQALRETTTMAVSDPSEEVGQAVAAPRDGALHTDANEPGRVGWQLGDG